jgi:exopolysaccharide biosynthesis polyprenyl glycosylphosphotransferase
MKAHTRAVCSKVSRSVDLFVLLFTLVAGLSLTASSPRAIQLKDLLVRKFSLRDFIVLLLMLCLWSGLSQISGGSSRPPSLARKRVFEMSLTLATLCCIVLPIAAFMDDAVTLRPVVVLYFWGLIAVTLSLVHPLWHFAVRCVQYLQRGHRRILIVGTSGRCVQFAKTIETNLEFPGTIVGFVDDPWPGLDSFQKSYGYPVLTNLRGLGSYIENNVVDEVIVGLPLASLYAEATRIVRLAEAQGLVVRCLSDLFATQNPPTEWREPLPGCVTVSASRAVSHSSVGAKRVLDVLLSSSALILLAPLFLLVALAIKLTSSGPVVFTQQRSGLNKRLFRIYKFRTMVQNAEAMLEKVLHLNEETGPAFKIRNDPRVTRLGQILRKSSLDELPQLWNVLKGDMSLVGPRPLFSWEYQRIEDGSVKRRLCIKPGLTGLWQVSGRSNINFEKRVQMDLAYIDNWSLALDCKLLLKTIPVVLFRKGAV